MSNTRSIPVPDSSDRKRERHAIVEWALAVGRPAQREALAQLQTMKVGYSQRRSVPYNCWTEAVLFDMLWVETAAWSRQAHPAARARMAETLWTYLQFLGAHRLMHPRSASVDDLLEIIGDAGGLTSDGRCRSRPQRAPVIAMAGRSSARRTRSIRTPMASAGGTIRHT